MKDVTHNYFAARFFDGEKLLVNVSFTIKNGLINSLRANSLASDTAEVLDGLVSPGFIDIQVNGGGGDLFNSTPSVNTLNTMATAHLQFGTTSMLPTVITDRLSVMEEAAESIASVMAAQHSIIVGVHFEGPHLSLPKRGIHSAEYVRAITDKELQVFSRTDLGKVVVTVAPETVAPDVIKELSARGVLVFLGHSNTDAETALKAIEAGAVGFTHLYNAMSPLTSREPGMVGAALSAQQAYCGIIVDHHHVHPLSVKLAYQCKGAQRMILVTDAMAHVGSDMQQLPYMGTVIQREGSKLTLPDGTLAGSALDMIGAVKNCHFDLQIPLVDSLRMATSTPANLLNAQHRLGYLRVGQQANMLLLDDALSITHCWVNGIKQHNNNM
ncbi:MAG: N-acetylglucosamine-6-phosphate deacetylase [Paraglaciecola sp.]|uniref:N-acetylglucosamine-6-phosphate deacetylase n=1 Tax=Paraglaciecola sp. TaxID=1920173 RepID=UPI00273E4121|nr:N-acetylglucosamine-6-phosphate deacetylase [Paraglaciecola sp.]MDP5031951.1 N-acetylglucosamine-6-phosphate deacetylase [Paraglaciecola sp.]MDP5129458.1 N-acetylglucosamine-6-phosphate deacetylase [Paraglaciecola sp.]